MTFTLKDHERFIEREGFGPCVKQTVTARIVATTGEEFVSTNYCKKPQTLCPRQDMPTGQGYEKCKNICHQDGHAEENAVALAGDKARGSVLYLTGHYYACDNCQKICKDAGVKEIILLTPKE